jgi:hypothetical protein
MRLTAWALTVALALTGCDDDPSTPESPDRISVPVNAAVASALSRKPFTFAGGIPELGTVASTTVTFSSGFGATFESGAGSASASLRFGSCIFTLITSTFDESSSLVKGKTVTVDPCTVLLDDPMDTATLTLGASSSEPVSVPIEIDCTGNSCSVTSPGMAGPSFSGSAGG